MGLKYRQTDDDQLNQFQEETISAVQGLKQGQGSFPPFGAVLERITLGTDTLNVSTGVAGAKYAIIIKSDTVGVTLKNDGGADGTLALTGSGAAIVDLWVF